MRRAPEDGEDLVSWPWKRLRRLMWVGVRLIWATGIVGIGLNIVAAWLIAPSLPLRGTPLGWLVEHPQLTLSVTLVLVLLTALTWLGSRGAAYRGSQGGRSAMLQLLKVAYRRDQDASLRGMIRRIELKMREQLDLIPSAEQTPPELHTSAFGVTRGGEQPFHMQIVQAYRQAGERLLVVGAAGAGKSILLYDLALALLDEAEHDKELPLPVIVHLSSWGQRNLSFVEWIALELAQRFRYPRPLWRRWLRKDRLFLILDGLDAVAPAKRGACIEAVNTYSREHVTPLVVCSRLEEYLAAPRQIALQGAVVVQPLEYESIVEYLKDAGANLAPVRTVVERDPELKMLLTSPLMLAIMTSSYRGEDAEDLSPRSQAQWREHIFDHYLQHMLGERPLSFGAPQQFRRWLPWLARRMQGQQHVLYIEQLQSDWLTHRWAKWAYAWLGVILPGAFIGFLVTAFLINFVMPIYDVSGLLAGSFPGAVVGGLLGYESIPRRGESQLGWNNLLSMGARSVLLGLGTALATIFLDLSIRHSFSLALIGQYARVDGIIFGIWIAFLVISLPLTRATTQQGSRSARFLLGISKYFGDNLLTKSTTKTGMLIGISAALSYGLSHELRYGLSYALSNALSYGLSYSLGGVLIDVILTQKSTVIEPTEILTWSWKKFGSSLLDKDHLKRTLTMGLGTLVIIGLSFGLGFGLILGLSFGPQYTLIYGLSYGLSFGPILGLGFAGSFWLLTGLFQGVRSEELKVRERITPNLGIRRSFSNAWQFGVWSGIVGTTVSVMTIMAGYGLSFGVSFGASFGFELGLQTGLDYARNYGIRYGLEVGLVTFLTLGLTLALYHGGLAWWRHYVLRFLLWLSGTLPWRCIHMLDEATYRILMTKVGGGYRFFHDLFGDYLASLCPPVSTSSLFSSSRARPWSARYALKMDVLQRLTAPILSLMVALLLLTLPADASGRFDFGRPKEKGHLSYGYVANFVYAEAYAIKLNAKKMSPGPTGFDFPTHINAYMTVNLNNGNWIEVGIVSGYQNWEDNKQDSSLPVNYSFYWADSAQQNDLNPDNDVYWTHTIENIVPDGNDYELAITSQGNGVWFIYLQGQMVGESLYTDTNTARGQTVGLKFAGGDHDGCGNNASADDFSIEPKIWNGDTYVDWSGNPTAQRQDASFKVGWEDHHVHVSKKLC